MYTFDPVNKSLTIPVTGHISNLEGISLGKGWKLIFEFDLSRTTFYHISTQALKLSEKFPELTVMEDVAKGLIIVS